MPIKFGATSASRMIGLHPKLLLVLNTAASIATKEEDFSILEGVRSDEVAYANFGKGRTAAQCRAAGCPEKYAQPKLAKVTWLKNPLNTKHRKQKDGYSHAFDALPYPFTNADWNNAARFNAMADLMFRAAAIAKVKIRWGADWDEDGKPREKGEFDSPHFELSQKGN